MGTHNIIKYSTCSVYWKKHVTESNYLSVSLKHCKLAIILENVLKVLAALINPIQTGTSFSHCNFSLHVCFQTIKYWTVTCLSAIEPKNQCCLVLLLTLFILILLHRKLSLVLNPGEIFLNKCDMSLLRSYIFSLI